MSRIGERSRLVSCVALAAIATAVSGGPAAAQTQDYFSEQKTNRLTYRVEGERSRTEKIVVWSMAGATVVTGGLGVLFNLKSRDAADEVRALSGDHTGLIYSSEIDGRRRDAERFGTAATVLYAAGGALVVGTVVAYIVTSPPDEIREYKSGSDSRVALPYVVPVEGGALVGKVWTY